MNKKLLKKIIPKNQKKVSLFIVGAQKAGTSALHQYLVKHPNVLGGKQKEINFFNHHEKFSRGVEWYHSQFKSSTYFNLGKIYVDATPQYLSNIGIAKKIYEYNPKAKIVILLREPVSRAFSAWNMYKQFSELPKERKKTLLNNHIDIESRDVFTSLINKSPFPDFKDFINKELIENHLISGFPGIIQRGIYVDQITPYYELFGSDNVAIYESNYFKNNKLQVTNDLLHTVGLSSLSVKDADLKTAHVRNYDDGIEPQLREKLRLFYYPHNQRLFDLIDQQFNW